MPVRKVGNDCYQWGNQKVYCGKDAKRKAILQGIAIENTGWREAEEIQITSNQGLIIPAEFKEDNPTFMLHEGYLLISQDRDNKWRIWNMDKASFQGWNYFTAPLNRSYSKNYDSIEPLVFQFDNLQDALSHAEWYHDKSIADVKKWLEGDDDGRMPHGFVSPIKYRIQRMKMTDEEKEMNRHPNRGSNWVPNRLIKELGTEMRTKLDDPCLKGKVFPSIMAADRHKFYCEKYGFQPPNKLYFTPMEIMLLEKGLLQTDKKHEAETVSSSNLLLLLGVGTLGLLIPYFLDSRANKV